MKIGHRMLLSALVGGVGCMAGYALPHLGALLHLPAPQTHVQAHVQTHAQTVIAPLPGATAPDFTLVDAAGNAHHLHDFRGQPVLVNFWASWCGTCRSEMPVLRQAVARYQGRVQVVGVNVTAQDTQEAAQAFLHKYQIRYLNLFDPNGAVARDYQLQVVPTTLLLDARGVVVERFLGPLTADMLEQWCKKFT